MKIRVIAVLLMLEAIPAAASTDNARHVNPFIGTDGNGHCNPGAARPFAMVQPGPDTGSGAWRYCAGYQYEDVSIRGFSQNHLCGTGQGEMGDVLLLPFCGEEVLRKSSFSHANETATPGYYAVTLDEAKVRAEMTSTERVACHRYTYLGEGQKHLLVDLQHGLVGEPKWANKMTIEGHAEFAADGRSLSGSRLVEQYWPRHRVFFYIVFNRPIVAKRILKNEIKTENGERWVLDFDIRKDEALEIKVALSYKSVEGAKNNLMAETPKWDFDGIRRESRQSWNDILSRLEINGGTEDQRAILYTSLYHLCYQPNVISDVGEKVRYSTFSFWDTYRAAHPLYTLLVPERVDGFVDSILDHAKMTDFMPIWEIYGQEGYDMIGAHSIPVVLDAWRKGFDVDLKAFYPFVKRTQTENNRAYIARRNGKPFENCHWELLDKLGHYPCDVVTWGNLSRIMETTFDDWCAAEMAKELGIKEDESFFRRRADMWKNVFKKEAGWICPRKSNGEWLAEYDPAWLIRPKSFRDGFCADTMEGSGFQWSFHVLHDVTGLVSLMGGRHSFLEKLDYLFTHEPFWENDKKLPGVWPYREVSGRIGEYAHGNEPCHHIAYLYSLAGERVRTGNLVRRICATQYANRVDGICGNEDCGQMGAWYLFAALGFYPVNPASGEYVLGMPLFDEVRLALPNGTVLHCVRQEGSNEVSLNGETLLTPTVSHKSLLAGGELNFGTSSDVGHGNSGSSQKIEAVCIYYPEWHVYPAGDEIFGKNQTEWNFVKDNPARFPGHEVPVVPVKGYYDDSNPTNSAWEIDLAADAGLDVFLFDWYWYQGVPKQQESLEDGFLRAPNRMRMKFALMWAYHDRDDAFRSPLGHFQDRYFWRLAHTREDFLAAIGYAARHYFREPNYWKREGKLFFSMYNAWLFIKKNGGVEAVRELFAAANKLMRDEGLPEIHFSAMVDNDRVVPQAVAAGFESVSVYSITPPYVHSEKRKGADCSEWMSGDKKHVCVLPYAQLAEERRALNGRIASVSPVPYFPLVSRGWDSSGRCQPEEPFPWKRCVYPYIPIVKTPTVEEFASHLKEARELASALGSGAVMVNAWNEYTEGSYLVPDVRHGDAFLRAVRSVVREK